MLDGQLSLLPDSIGIGTATLLIIVSFFSSALTAALSLGGGTLILAVMAAVVPASAVIPVHGIVQLGSNSGRALLMGRHARWHIVAPLLMGGAVGAFFGGQVVVNMPAGLLQGILGLFILGVTWLPGPRRREVGRGGYVLAGGAASFLTMFVGATGPFTASVLNGAGLDRHAMVATHALAMTFQHGLKVIVFGWLGFAFGSWLVLIGLMIGSGFLGTLTGRALLDRLPERTFRIVLRWVLSLLALNLLINATGNLMRGG